MKFNDQTPFDSVLSVKTDLEDLKYVIEELLKPVFKVPGEDMLVRRVGMS